MPLKIAAVLVVAIILQLSLRAVWSPLSYIDFPLVVVVYIALQRHAWHALLVGTVAGLAVDAASGGLIGAGGFSKTLTAYLIYLLFTSGLGIIALWQIGESFGKIGQMLVSRQTAKKQV